MNRFLSVIIVLLCISVITSGCDYTTFDAQNIFTEDKREFKVGSMDRIEVTLDSTVDGDTARFSYKGKVSSFRFLLIDTPETRHPRLGKQPFGQEASDRTESLLKNANKIEVEFDVGQKQDKYNRYLAYIYVDGKMLNEILVKEGLAEVGYVYPPNTRYIDRLNDAQSTAKERKRGIWSLQSAFLDEKQESVGRKHSKSVYPNCTELRKDFPNGVSNTHEAYQTKLDRDKDGFSCEQS